MPSGRRARVGREAPGTVVGQSLLLIRAGGAAVVAAMVIPTGVTSRRAVIGEAWAAHVVGVIRSNPQVEALVVEEDPDGGTKSVGVQALDLDPDLLLLAEGPLVNHHHPAQDPGHLADDGLRPSDVWEAGHKDPSCV